jgi:lysophospholipase L1-like esterase
MQSTHRRKLVRLAVLAALLASLVGNAGFALLLKDAFDRLHFVRNFPAGYPPQPRTQAPAAGHSIAFWGDSRAFLWDMSPWSSRMSVDNRAHGGMTSSQLVYQLWSESAQRTDYAVLQIGINDLHPLGALEPYKAQILAQLKRNVLIARDALLARSEIVVLTTLFPPAQVPLVRRMAWDSETLRHIDDINDLIRGAADGRRVLLLDAHRLLAGTDARLAARYVDDDFFLHVNRDAYELLNQQLGQLLASHSSSRN